MLNERFRELEKRIKGAGELINRLKQEKMDLELRYAEAQKKIADLMDEMSVHKSEEEEFAGRVEELLEHFKEFPEEEEGGYEGALTLTKGFPAEDERGPGLILEPETDLDNYIAQFELGRRLEKKGLWDKAVEAYRRAIDVKPDYVDAVEHLAFLLEKLNREKEASPLWERVISLRK